MTHIAAGEEPRFRSPEIASAAGIAGERVRSIPGGAMSFDDRTNCEANLHAVRSPSTPSAACAAASRATGTRNGLHET